MERHVRLRDMLSKTQIYDAYHREQYIYAKQVLDILVKHELTFHEGLLALNRAADILLVNYRPTGESKYLQED